MALPSSIFFQSVSIKKMDVKKSRIEREPVKKKFLTQERERERHIYLLLGQCDVVYRAQCYYFCLRVYYPLRLAILGLKCYFIVLLRFLMNCFEFYENEFGGKSGDGKGRLRMILKPNSSV